MYLEINCQIADGFIVHRTKDVNDTVALLKAITTHLTGVYENRTVYAKSVEKLENHALANHPTFSSFNDFCNKSQDLTVKHQFQRMLVHVTGVTQKKAATITDIYPTFSSIAAAYDSFENQKEAEKLLSEIKVPGTKRRLGVALSKSVYKAFYT